VADWKIPDSIQVAGKNLGRLLEAISDCDYCYLCNQHPGSTHRGHRDDCPLRNPTPWPDDE